MKFRKYASDETASLIARLLKKRSEEALHGLRALRQALDETTKAVENALGARVDADSDKELANLIERLTASAGAEVQASTDRVKAETQAAVDAMRAQLEEKTNQQQELAASLKEMKAHADALRGEAQTHKERADGAIAELAKSRDAHAKTEAALKESEGNRQQEARAKAAVENELREAQKTTKANAARMESLDKTSAEADRARRDLQLSLDAAAAAEKMLRQRLVDAERAVDHTRTRAQTASPEATLERLLSVSGELARASSIADALKAVAHGLASDFSRVALFSAKGNRLECVFHTGFDSKTDVSKIVIPMTMDSLLTQAVTSRRVGAFAAQELADHLRGPFGGTPTCVLALPVSIHGEPVAVIYADDSDQPHSEAVTLELRAKFGQVLQQYAVAALEKLKADLKTIEELRAYATLLLDEVEYVYSADVSAGKKEAEAKSRLKDNLACARQMYAQRAGAEGPAAAAVFDERIAAVVEARGGTPFGRDLAVAGGQKEAPGKKSRQAAQAS
jgi:hypothetical protein